MRAANRPVATPSQTMRIKVGQPPACSMSVRSGEATPLISIGSAITWDVIIRGAKSTDTGRSIVSVIVGISSRNAGMSHRP